MKNAAEKGGRLQCYLSSEELSEMLHELSREVKRGHLEMGEKDASYQLTIGEEMVFELSLKEGIVNTIQIKLTWKHENTEEQQGLIISS